MLKVVRYWPALLIAASLTVAVFGEWSSAQNHNQNNHTKPASDKKPSEIPWPSSGGWVAIFTGLLFVSTTGLWTVTRTLAGAAKLSADAAKLSADATRQIQRHAEASERAYVKISHCPPGLTINAGTSTAKAVFRIENSGRTPARP